MDSVDQGARANAATSSSSSALRRSCQHCRKRKIKCIVAHEGAASCKACTSKGQPCVFEKQSQMGRPPKTKSSKHESSTSTGHPQPSSPSASSSSSTNAAAASRKRPAAPSDASRRNTDNKKSKADNADSTLAYPYYTQSLSSSSSSLPYYSHNHLPDLATSIGSSSRSDLPFLLNDGSGTSSTALSTAAANTPPHYYSDSLPFQQQQYSHPLQNTTLATSSLNQIPFQGNHAAASSSTSSSSKEKSIWVQTEADPYPHFRHEPLHSLASAFHDILSSSASHLPSTTPASAAPVLGDPRIPPMARIRTLTARATATRKPIDRGPHAATPNYARSLISPLWDGLPVDIIALTTTGKPSASGPFSISSEASKKKSEMHGPPSAAHDEYLYVKLLREDESGDFQMGSNSSSRDSTFANLPSHPGLAVFAKGSPGYRYAPDKMTIGKYFTGYFSKHPLAPLVLNERLFLDDLMNNSVDPLLLHVIVGSSIARAPCLGAGNDDAEDIGDEFFRYIERELLSRTPDGACDLQTCQSLMLWATHELSHMRVRRANALFSTADVLLRQRLQTFQTRVEEEATYTRLQREGRDMSGLPFPTPLGWRDLVEQELAVNSLWVLVIWNTWTSLSLKLPHTTMSVMASNLPAPPQSVLFSSSFAFAYSTPDITSPLQPVVRRTIERFSDMTQLISVIVSLKNQSHARNLFTPDPPRPLAVVDDEEAQIATWLVDLAKFYNNSDASGSTDKPANNQQLVPQGKLSDSSRSFLVASHAVLALHQILPYATASSNSYGSPLPLPTVESLRTALTALHLVARSIQVSSPGSRTRTQAILLDSMPRILSLLDVFTTSSLSSLDHFVLVTSQRQTVHELLDDLNKAIACMSSPTARSSSLESCGAALEKSSKGLRTVVDIGLELQQAQIDDLHAGRQLSQNPGGTFGSLSSKVGNSTGPGTPSTPSSTAEAAPWPISSAHYNTFSSGNTARAQFSGSHDIYQNRQAQPSHQPQHSLSMYAPHSGMLGNSLYGQPDHFSMSSHLANSPLLRTHDRGVMASPSYVGSLHAFL